MISKEKDEIYKRLEKAEKVSERAKDLTQQLLTFSKGGAPIKKPGSIEDLLRETVSFILSGSNIKCRYLIQKKLWHAEYDTGQMSQVINNLIINALEAMSNPGTFKIKADNITIEKDDFLPLKTGNYVRFSITDNGTGIREEHLPKIFDPYFTTKAKGSGLGLTTSYSIIKRHNGHIDVNSTVDKGSAFTVYIPASSEILRRKKKISKKILKGSGRILLMDDDENFREVAHKMLSRLGYAPYLATDGKEAINMFRKSMERRKPYKAVIMDLTVLGGLGGKETTRQILKLDSNARIIVCSGYSNDPVMADYIKYGFCGVLTKPFSIHELGKVLHSCVVKKSDEKT
jgi:CheY-like chemotaxis protein